MPKPQLATNRLEGLRVVAIGGGTGLSTLLRGLKRHVVAIPAAGSTTPAAVAPFISRLTGIVTVTDDGGSSGRLRKELGVPPPGDIRNCMTALSDDEELLNQLFCYRFRGGGLGGHSFGNLFLTAMAEVCGDFPLAVQLSSAILKTRGEIYPSSINSNVQLDALMRNGKRVRGETKITASRSGIARLNLVPANARPLPQALRRHSRSRHHHHRPRIAVHQLHSQPPGARSSRSHLPLQRRARLHRQPHDPAQREHRPHRLAAHPGHLRPRRLQGLRLRHAQLHPRPRELRARYAEDNSEPLRNDLDQIRALGVTPILGDYLDASQFARHAADRIVLDLLNLPARLQRELHVQAPTP